MANWTLEQAEDIAMEIGAEVYEGYSGRGMYGKETVGLVVDDISDLVRVGYAAAELDVPENVLPRRYDNLGRSIIIY